MREDSPRTMTKRKQIEEILILTKSRDKVHNFFRNKLNDFYTEILALSPTEEEQTRIETIIADFLSDEETFSYIVLDLLDIWDNTFSEEEIASLHKHIVHPTYEGIKDKEYIVTQKMATLIEKHLRKAFENVALI